MKGSSAHRGLVMIGTHPEAKGGIATVVAKYRQFGLFEKWRVTYICTHAEVSTYRKFMIALSAYWQMIQLLVMGRVGLVHIHAASRVSVWRKSTFAFTAFLFRVPYVLHMHGAEFEKFVRGECGPLRRGIVRALLRNAATVIALSESWALKLRELAPGAHVEVVYNSVSLPPKPKTFGHNDVKNGILFLGQIGMRKGAFDLIRAFAVVSGGVKLALGGDGDVKKASELARRLGISERIQMLGWVTGENKEAVLSRASIFVLPSYNEGLPMSVLEAMAWGLPVITTPVGGIPEVVRQGEEGVIVQPGDIDGLTAALRQLLDDEPLRQRLGANGRRRIQHLFSDEVVFPQLEAIWARFGLLPYVSKTKIEAQESTKRQVDA
ncbi:Glycosyltransferase involved in cell wall bisynthesis [Nitrosospira sp. Nsp11]|uniref:glycosyltransferase family 4 protein n=1 Tax=Nitrosospira sp. Nsp11 TaxID=1855338 RepID=UPI000923A4A4|nr:Glycosyltransferase involved in cell wall bisynthesis [Nitrosospira sp. Nsp11]